MENDTLSTAATKTLGLSISLFKIKQLLLGDMFESSASGVYHTVAYECAIYLLFILLVIPMFCLARGIIIKPCPSPQLMG